MKFNELVFERFIDSIVANIRLSNKLPPQNSIGCFYNNKLFMLNKQALSALINNPDFNYQTSINPAWTTEEIRKYFVGTVFNMGVYPAENMQRCVDVEVSEADND